MTQVFIATGSTGKIVKVMRDLRTVELFCKCLGWFSHDKVGGIINFHYAGGRFAGRIAPVNVDDIGDIAQEHKR